MDYIEDSFGLIRNLKLARFRLKLQAREKIILPEFKGSTFRGVLGWRLKKVLCSNRDVDDCSKCLLASKCLYNYLFSPPLPQNTQFLKHTSRIPAPILIEPPLTEKRIFESNEILEASLVLTGKGLEYLPYLIFVFTEMGKNGIGAGLHEKGGKKRGGRFELVEVYDEMGGKQIYSNQKNVLCDDYQIFGWNDALEKSTNTHHQKITLEFLTPARIKEERGKKNRLTRLSSFGQLITHLYWRLLLLSYFHNNPSGLGDERFAGLAGEAGRMRKELFKQAEDVKLETNHTYWQEYERWSNRQQTKMILGGFMGKVTFSGNITPYLPLLHLGEYTHFGKQTMFGLGKYRIIQ